MWNEYSTTWKFLGTFNSGPRNLNVLAYRSNRRNTWSLHILGCLFIFLLALPIFQPARSLVSIISESFRSSWGYFPFLSFCSKTQMYLLYAKTWYGLFVNQVQIVLVFQDVRIFVKNLIKNEWNQKHIDQARAEQSIELQISWKLLLLLCLPIQWLLVKSATCFQIFRYLHCQSNSQAGS